MRKILILTPFYPPNIGGAETYVQGLVDEVWKHHNVDVITFMPFKKKAKSFEKHTDILGNILRIYRIKWPLSHAQAWAGIGFRNFLSVFPKMLVHGYLSNGAKRYEIIHAQGLISCLVGALIKKKNQKLFVTLLALYNLTGIKRAMARWALRKCDIIFVEGKRGEINAGNLSGKWSRIKKFRHWCDQNKFKPNDKKDNKKIRVLFIGRPLPEKGIHFIKQAEHDLKDPGLEFEYVTNVEFEKLPEIYRRSHILCVPSQYDEGFSRVVIEGACSGLAIIASDRGALPEQVKQFGVIAKTRKDWKSKIHMMSKGGFYEDYGKMAFEYAKNNYSNTNAEVFLNEYGY